MKSITVKAAHPRQAIAIAARELGMPRKAKVKDVKFNKKTKKWKVTFQ